MHAQMLSVHATTQTMEICAVRGDCVFKENPRGTNQSRQRGFFRSTHSSVDSRILSQLRTTCQVEKRCPETCSLHPHVHLLCQLGVQRGHRSSTYADHQSPLLAADQSFVAASIVATVLNVFSLSAFPPANRRPVFLEVSSVQVLCSCANSVVDAGDLLKHHRREQVLERTASVRQCGRVLLSPNREAMAAPELDSVLIFSVTCLTEGGQYVRGLPAFGCCWPHRMQL